MRRQVLPFSIDLIPFPLFLLPQLLFSSSSHSSFLLSPSHCSFFFLNLSFPFFLKFE